MVTFTVSYRIGKRYSLIPFDTMDHAEEFFCMVSKQTNVKRVILTATYFPDPEVQPNE